MEVEQFAVVTAGILGAIAWEWRLSVVIGARRLPRAGRMPFSRMSLATERFEMRKPRAFNSA